MNALQIVLVASLAVLASAKPSGHGVLVAGPSGIVTDHGVGHWDTHSYYAPAHAAEVATPVAHTVVSAPVVSHTIVVTPPVHGYSEGLAHGWAGYGEGLAHGWTGYAQPHGVLVKGPETAPAVIKGPSGKIVANGLWGVENGYTGYAGHHW